MFEQFTSPEQPLSERLVRWFQISGSLLIVLTSPMLVRSQHQLPELYRAVGVGIAVGLEIAAMTLHLTTKRQRRSQQSAGIQGI